MTLCHSDTKLYVPHMKLHFSHMKLHTSDMKSRMCDMQCKHGDMNLLTAEVLRRFTYGGAVSHTPQLFG